MRHARPAGWLGALSLPACAPVDGIVSPAGPVASAQLGHLIFIALMVSIVVIPIFVFLPFVFWRYRQGSGKGAYRPDWTFSWPLELAVWGVPIAIVSVLGWQTWHQTRDLDPYRPITTAPPLRVEVIGLDWKWLFLYPDEGIATIDRLIVPAGRDIAFRLTADGPMTSFIVPRLGGQIYAMAGMTTQLHLLAAREGTFGGRNTQYNGKGFAQQHFAVSAVSAAKFDDWVKWAGRAPRLDRATYARLAQSSVIARPLIFGRVDAGLFDAVVAKYAGHRHDRLPSSSSATIAAK